MMACWSPPLPAPPSIGVPGPNGYGPGSLSWEYWNVTRTLGWLELVTTKGIPYGTEVPESPKSGWMSRFGPPLFANHAALCGSTGRFEMSVFHALSAGNTGHPAMLGPDFDWTALGAVGLVVAMGTVEATDPGVESRIDVGGCDLSVVDVVEGALVDGVDVSVGLDTTVLPGAKAGVPGSVWPDPERWPALHEAVSDVTMTPATNIDHRFDRFGIADLAPDTPLIPIGCRSPAI
jgi:hypothetical protein